MLYSIIYKHNIVCNYKKLADCPIFNTTIMNKLMV